ncbi:MAG TPA: DUF4920 domain-containing protein [Myxococcota bacterium]
MKKISVALLASLAVTVACETSRAPIGNDNGEAPVVDEEAEDEDELPPPFIAEEAFGADLVDETEIAYVDFDTLLATPEQFTDQVIEVRGTVRQSCQEKGCWMTVRSNNDANSAEMTVRFKDYGFFMPFNSRGSLVRYQGTLHLDILSPAEVAELQREGYSVGTLEPDGSAKQLLFVAYGVQMSGRDRSGR